MKWNAVINLMSKAAAHEVWTRHFPEAAELPGLAGNRDGLWLDLGSGGGLPAAVVAIIFAETHPGLRISCIESDIRKCEFLKTVARRTETEFSVMNRRIEECPAQNANVVSARALAPLQKLLGYTYRHLSPDGIALFPKGATWQDEVRKAKEAWKFDMTAHPSTSNAAAAILEIRNIQRV